MLLVERYRSMDDIISKKRDRIVDEDESPDAIQPNKKLLQDIFTSLNLSEHNATPYEVGTITECIPSESSDMETDSENVIKNFSNVGAENRLVCPESENIYSMLKNGTRKYGRRVDYLVDDLIRKSQKTYTDNSYPIDFDLEAIVPSSIGPHPLTDRMLGKLWPTVVPTMEGASMLSLIERPNCRNYTSDSRYSTPMDSEQNSDDEECASSNVNYLDSADQNSVEMNEIVADCEKVALDSGSRSNKISSIVQPITETQKTNNKNCGEHPAGLITHSDWGIEDVT